MGYTFTVYRGSPDGTIRKVTTHKDDLMGEEVFVETTHSGVCGTDCHYRHTDMGLGHEGAGVVKAIGPDVAQLKIGDRVGFGYVHGSCGHCLQCRIGYDINCAEVRMYAVSELDQGSFSSHGVWKESFLFRLPDALDSADAAPLMCGGMTVFNAMVLHGVKTTDCVGVVGIGGLGHLAIQFAAKMGCEVVAFSGTEAKRAEVLKLGAHHFYATKDVKELSIKRKIDHLLVTTSNQPDWNLYIPVMAPRGTFYPLSVTMTDLVVPQMPMVMAGLKVVYATGGPRQALQSMLEFAALHQIKPVIQPFPLTEEGVAEALERLDRGEVRYRAVLYGQ